MKKIKENKLQKLCEYRLPNCQKLTDLQWITKLGSVNISKYWICENCKQIVEKYKDQLK